MSKYFRQLLIFGLVLSVMVSLFYSIWNTFWTSGDEPHYLTVTNSLIGDKDFNVGNDYANQVYYWHHSGDIGRHGFQDLAGNLRPMHALGTSVLAAPGYLTKKIEGVRISFLLYNLVGMGVLVLLLRHQKFSINNILLTLTIVGIQPAIIYYNSAIFPDLIQGYLMLGAGYLSLRFFDEYKNRYLFLASSILGITTFFHFKLIAFQIYIISIVGFLFFIKLLRSKQKLNSNAVKLFLLNLLMPVTCLNLFASWVNYRWFGFFRPDTMTPFLINTELAKPANPFINVLAMLFDYHRGLFPFAPALLFIFTGLVIWFIENRKSFYILALPSLLYLFTAGFFADWHAGWCPPGRYVMTSLPLLFPALSFSIQKIRDSKILLFLVTVFSGLSLVMCYLIFKLVYFGYPLTKTNPLLDKIFENYLVIKSLLNFNMFSPIVTDFMTIILIIIFFLAYGYKLADKK
jgi:hypothetical protein